MGSIKKKKPQGSKNIKDPVSETRQPLVFQKPVFSLQEISNNNEYSFKKCSDDEKLALMQRLYELSQMTWAYIHNQPKHGYGSEKIKIPKKKIPAGTPGDRQFLALRFYTGNRPFVGYICKTGIFHITWIDRNHTLYTS